MIKMSVCIEENDYVEAAERVRQELTQKYFNGNEERFYNKAVDIVNDAIELFMMELEITVLD